jgi:hypothetical protein
MQLLQQHNSSPGLFEHYSMGDEESQGVLTLDCQDATHSKVKAFSFATSVIYGMQDYQMQASRHLGTQGDMAAPPTMKVLPIRRHFPVIAA